MKSSTLIVRSLTHYWKTHLAVLLGVIVGTAVIGGALLVGDSVRGSLRQMTLDRLGGIDFALQSPRFFTESIIGRVQERSSFKDRVGTVAPALVMDGGLVRQAADGTISDRAGGVRVYGVEEHFAELSELRSQLLPHDDQLVLSHRVAEQLQAKVGDQFTLWVELPTNIPRDTLLGGAEEQTTREIALTVSHILPQESGVGRLDLNPSQQLPKTVFVSLRTLQQELGLETVRRSKEFPNGKPARINTLFLSASHKAIDPSAFETSKSLTSEFRKSLTLDDLSLRIVQGSSPGSFVVESEQMILEGSVSEAVRNLSKRKSWPTSSVMVYLANQLSNAKDPKAFSMYSIVAGVDLLETQQAPFGPLCPECAQPVVLADDEIILNDWLAEDLKVKPGDSIKLTYHLVGSHGELPEEELTFRVKHVVPMNGSVTASDRRLTPEVRGITDAKSFADWKQPFPMDINKVTSRDDSYWEDFRALPKAFVSLSNAQRLWKSKYGDVTSVRVSVKPSATPNDPDAVTKSQSELTTELLNELGENASGFDVAAVKWQGLQAASGTTDFTGLFVGFSFFVIAAAMVLIGLLFRLGVERRVSQVGLLTAVGFTPQRVRKLLLVEGLAVAAVGGVLGCVAAVGYAELMVAALKSPRWWGGALGTQFLFVFITPSSLIGGFAISFIVAWLALYAALRGLDHSSPRELLAGVLSNVSDNSLSGELSPSARLGHRQQKIAFGCFAFAVPVLLLGVLGLIPSSEAFSGLSWQVVAFFLVGIALMVGALQQFSASLSRQSGLATRGRGFAAITRLAYRNAGRNRSRSILSTALIASATFVIVAVAAGRRDPAKEAPDVNSGNGGFVLVAESATPVLPDLNTAAGRAKVGLIDGLTPELKSLIENSAVTAFGMKPGENASCLNIYQTQLPTVLGVPKSLMERGGFRFIDGRKADYWKLLNTPREDGRIPVLGDMNTLMFSLHRGPGSFIPITNAKTPGQEFAVVGMLDSSVFQGVLLVSEDNFRKLYPEQVGYRYFLIGAQASAPIADPSALITAFETKLASYGFDAERVSDRIASFLIVQNTYLSTFLTLGGLGLLLGTIGLGTVMLRNVVERRSELGLLSAVGFKQSSLGMLVLVENALLLVVGLGTGTIGALLAMLPHLISIGADTPWLDGGRLLVLVFVAGMLSAAFAVRDATQMKIVAALRGD